MDEHEMGTTRTGHENKMPGTVLGKIHIKKTHVAGPQRLIPVWRTQHNRRGRTEEQALYLFVR